MAYEFRSLRRIEFAQTDMAGIMHFSNFFRLMEETEHAFFRSLGLTIHQDTDDYVVGWPRVDASCQFERPLRFEDEVEIQVLVRKIRSSAVVWQHIFRKVTPEGLVEVARGQITAVCVKLNKGAHRMKAIPIPDTYLRCLEVAPSELLD